VLFDSDFVREQESRSAIRKLNQEHRAIQIANLSQDGGLLAKSGSSFMIANRLEQSAMPSRHFTYFALAHHISTSIGQCTVAVLIGTPSTNSH
jgi:butyrate kinase